MAAATGIELQAHRRGSDAGFVNRHKESGLYSLFKQAQVSQMCEIALDPNQIARPCNLHDFFRGAGEGTRRNSSHPGDELGCSSASGDKDTDVDVSQLTEQIHESEVRFVPAFNGAGRHQESGP